MKLYQFQFGENTRFVYKDTIDKHPVVNSMEGVKLEAHELLNSLKEEIDTDLKTGFPLWKRTEKKNGKIKMENTKTGEKVVMLDGKILKYKNKKGEKIKTHARKLRKSKRSDKNIKKVKTQDVTTTFRNDADNTAKRAVNKKEGGHAHFKDGQLETSKKFSWGETNPHVQRSELIIEHRKDEIEPQKEEYYVEPVVSLTEADKFLKRERGNETITGGSKYIIEFGDTLSNIAALCKNEKGKTLSWSVLYALNKGNLKGKDAHHIYPGEKITIPKGYTLNVKKLPAVRVKNKADWNEWRAKQASTNTPKKGRTNRPSTHAGGNKNAPTNAQTDGAEVVVIPSPDNTQQGSEVISYNPNEMSVAVTTCPVFMKNDGTLKKPEDVNTSLGRLEIRSAVQDVITPDDIKYLKRVPNLRIETDHLDILFLAPLDNITELRIPSAKGIPTTLQNLTELYAPEASFYLADFPNLKEFTGKNIHSAPSLSSLKERDKTVIIKGEIKTLDLNSQKNYLTDEFSQALPELKIDNSNVDDVISALKEKYLVIKKMEMLNAKNPKNTIDIANLDYSKIDARKLDLEAQAEGVIAEITDKTAPMPAIATKVDEYFENENMKTKFEARIDVLKTNQTAETNNNTEYDLSKMSDVVKLYTITTNGKLLNPEDLKRSQFLVISTLTDEDIKYLKKVPNLGIRNDDLEDISFLSPLTNITILHVPSATKIPKELSNLIYLVSDSASFNLSDFPNLIKINETNFPPVGDTSRDTIKIVDGEIVKETTDQTIETANMTAEQIAEAIDFEVVLPQQAGESLSVKWNVEKFKMFTDVDLVDSGLGMRINQNSQWGAVTPFWNNDQVTWNNEELLKDFKDGHISPEGKINVGFLLKRADGGSRADFIVEHTLPTAVMDALKESARELTEEEKKAKQLEQQSRELELKLDNLSQEFGIKSVFFWDEEEYDYKEIDQNIPNIKTALQNIKTNHPDVLNDLKNIRIVLSESGQESGLRGTSLGGSVIGIDYKETSDKITQDIVTFVNEFKENEKKTTVKNKLDSLCREFGIKGIFLWSTSEYNYDKVEGNIPNIKAALQKIQNESPDILKTLKNIRITLANDKSEDGLTITDKDENVIEIDANEGSKEIANDIIDAVEELREKTEEKEKRNNIISKLWRIKNQFGIKSLILWNNKEYNYDKIEKNISDIKTALEKIKKDNPDIMNDLKKVGIALSDTDWEDGLKKSSDGNPFVEIDYEEDPEEIAQDLVDAVEEWREDQKEKVE